MEKASIKRLVEIMDTLRSENGCPWDKEQTLDTLPKFLLEECYELISAIETQDFDHIREELGDMLFELIFIAKFGKEQNKFTMDDVIKGIEEKIVRRHPHVFGDVKVKDTKEVLKNWDAIKKQEKKEQKKDTGTLSDIPNTMPSLLKAHRIGKRAAKAGFDWENVEGALDKVVEEIEEFKQAVKNHDKKATEEELGDMLFSITNVARFFEINPEIALKKTTDKFIKRFNFVEDNLRKIGKNTKEATLEEMENLWNDAKKFDKKL